MSPTSDQQPVEHREPTPGTVRQLYGTAFACGMPGCEAGLYVVDTNTGEQVLNSHVAHIHARRAGGPRWDPSMSEVDNRSAENLLLLCLLHAWQIDKTPEAYPADILRSWKRAQLAEYEGARKGWSITDADVEQAVGPLDLDTAIKAVIEAMPFSSRMRSRPENWQLAARRGHARRVARLAIVNAERREDVLAWMAGLDEPVVVVPAGEVRVLVARLGAGKSEQAARWWEQGLRKAAGDPEVDIPLYFAPRQIVSSLEQAVIDELGGDPAGTCRVVLDGLDSVPGREADGLLAEARQLVEVWSGVSVLATARPGLDVPAGEKIEVEPWPVERAIELAEVALGDRLPADLWSAETDDLLTSPLTALAVAARIDAGRDTRVSRARLLADLTPMLIGAHHVDVSDETWADAAQLAVALLDRPEVATAALFRPLPRLRRLVATDLVVLDQGELSFALAVFEQYFAAEAIISGEVRVEAVAAAGSFPRWRYAIAFAVSSSTPPEQEALLLKMAKVNPSAVFWILDEIVNSDGHETLEGPSGDVITALLRRRAHPGFVEEPDLEVRAGLWFREAEEALLVGLGPLAGSLVRHRDGKPTQWGVGLTDGYLTVARAKKAAPPPDVAKLVRRPPHLAEGWHRWTQFRFPTTDFGRWTRAQEELRRGLESAITRRTLQVPRSSWLARERSYLLAALIQDFGTSRRVRPVQLADVRGKLYSWLDRADGSERSTWGLPGHTVDSDDIRWLAAQLEAEEGDVLLPPWSGADEPHAGKWAWQAYSPELTLAVARDVVREALTGYRQLVELNFAAFGDAMGLYGMFPLRVEGLVLRPDNEEDPGVTMMLAFLPGTTINDHAAEPVDLSLIVEDHSAALWKFADRQRSSIRLRSSRSHKRSSRSMFGQNRLQQLDLPLHVPCPATSLAYHWLTHDLAAIRWLDAGFRGSD
ncbi:hypothetical protein [Amycolatopsis balhimycina]|uniref:hypothetical protein n=1 Tax=Amycolatopsis balhimycina TaxID=208443 RepID=UPI000F766C84|nr:hypothetical protein [Amycolatopsis balhimycina]